MSRLMLKILQDPTCLDIESSSCILVYAGDLHINRKTQCQLRCFRRLLNQIPSNCFWGPGRKLAMDKFTSSPNIRIGV